MVHHTVAPVQLSDNARRVAANPGGARIRGVTGTAGSGKSFALTARAARLAAEGKTVLVLCFNLTLANHLRRLVVDRCAELGANPARVTCTSFHTFCSRVVDDAAQAGIVATEPTRGTWPVKIVVKARDVLAAGFERRFDAVLVDEGQDYTVEWWNLLREHVVRPDGEMLLVADSTVDLYGKSTWDDPEALAAAGFTEPWIQMTSSYRMAPELIRSTNEFARSFIASDAVVPEVADDQEAVVGQVSTSVHSWRNIERVADLGVAVGRQVVRLLREHPELAPRDVVYLCEYHHDGLAAAREIESAGYPVHHVYSRDPDERHRSKGRFWPDADAVKGCTVHSFKGWDSPAVVVGVAMEDRSTTPRLRIDDACLVDGAGPQHLVSHGGERGPSYGGVPADLRTGSGAGGRFLRSYGRRSWTSPSCRTSSSAPTASVTANGECPRPWRGSPRRSASSRKRCARARTRIGCTSSAM